MARLFPTPLLLAAFLALFIPPLHAADIPPGTNDAVALVPVEYRHRLVQQLSLADANRQQWLDMLVTAKPDQRAALAFLLANMPERDLKSLTGEFLLKDVALAYEARAKFPWAAAVPEEIFFNDVLPYANLNERRDDWRGDFIQRFGPLVKDCKTAGEAAQALNREIFKQLNVSYHATKRLKPDQSPYESINLHYASCSGLSILLADACRAVGVPARVTGTPLWTDKSGNHTWVEAWDGQWRFMGAAEPGPFNKTWFGDLAAKADDSKPEHRIYAASFRQTHTPFILVWDPQSTDYGAVDVTGYYVHRQNLKIEVRDAANHAAPAKIQVRQDGRLIAQAKGKSASFELAANADYTIGAIVAGGKKIEKGAQIPRDADTSVELRIK
ncbi:MAG TPA: transglutaminase-like domain-containing protein [Tepidisphaeraceae bacterium]|nr:transglutaminase-like domain-containing protein [Tepidisphaeraceae bacterium]